MHAVCTGWGSLLVCSGERGACMLYVQSLLVCSGERGACMLYVQGGALCWSIQVRGVHAWHNVHPTCISDL